MSSIADKLSSIKGKLPPNVRLVAVSKTKTTEEIMEAYNAGQRIFGENKALELRDKEALLPHDIHWHFIGHLQSNKVKYIAPFVKMIHAVDSLKLLQAINKEAEKNKRVIKCLLQFHIANEESKYGLSVEEAYAILNSSEYKEMEHIKIAGVMGMATYTFNIEQVRHEFKQLMNIYKNLRYDYFLEDIHFREVSMGMSGDYQIAIQEGSTLVRIGSSIFGERNTH